MDDRGTPIHHASSYIQLLQEIKNLERYHDAKVMAGSPRIDKQDQSVHFGTKSTARDADIDVVSMETDTSPNTGLQAHWVPPSGLQEDYDNYPSSDLGKDGLL